MEERFIRLETKVSYQEKTIAELNEVVTAQQAALTALLARVARLEAQLTHQEDGTAAPHAEKPPHY